MSEGEEKPQKKRKKKWLVDTYPTLDEPTTLPGLLKERKGKQGWPKGKSRTEGRQLTTPKINQVVRLHIGGAGVNEIARAADIEPAIVVDTLKDFAPLFRELPHVAKYEYADVRRNLLSATEISALKLINDPRKLEAASLRDAAYAFKELYHAGRLERGLSTSNVQSQSFGVVTVRNAWTPETLPEPKTTDN